MSLNKCLIVNACCSSHDQTSKNQDFTYYWLFIIINIEEIANKSRYLHYKTKQSTQRFFLSFEEFLDTLFIDFGFFLNKTLDLCRGISENSLKTHLNYLFTIQSFEFFFVTELGSLEIKMPFDRENYRLITSKSEGASISKSWNHRTLFYLDLSVLSSPFLGKQMNGLFPTFILYIFTT